MKAAPKRSKAKLNEEQISIAASFADGAFDYPRKSFDQVARKLVGRNGFPRTAIGRLFRSECHKVFDRERRGM